MLIGARTAAWQSGTPYKKRLQYATCTGSQYFDTDVVAADDVGVSIPVCNCNSAGSANNSMVFGVFSSTARFGCGFVGKGGVGFLWWNVAINTSSTPYFATASPITRASLNYKNSRIGMENGVNYTLTETYAGNTSVIRLFNARREDTGANVFASDSSRSIGDVYISKGTADIRHYIPVISKSDTVEFYDLLTGTFATRSGTFTAGPEYVG